MSPRTCPPPLPLDPDIDPDEELARLAAALAHPARVRILRFLLQQDTCFAGAIVDHIPLAQSTVSRHLKVLRESGLIHGEVEGLHICYCADERRIRRFQALMAGLDRPAETPAPSEVPA